MTFLEPLWLVLAVPAALLLFLRPPPPGWRRGLRIAVTVAVVLGLARPSLLLPRRAGTAVVVVDRSASMPAGSDGVATEVIRGLEAARGGGDRLAVVAFGERSAVEVAPEGGSFGGFVAEVGDRRSALARALDAALALVPGGHPGRILVVGDGRFTGVDPRAAAGRAALAGVPIDYRLLERPATGDLAVDGLDAPLEVSPGEGFLITAWIRSPTRREVVYELERGGRVLARGRREVAAGRTRLTFRDRAAGPGVGDYRLTVRDAAASGEASDPAAADPVPGNDAARFLVGVRGPRPVLVVGEGSGALASLLEAGGLPVVRRAPGELGGRLEELAAASAVVLEDVPSQALGSGAMAALAEWVRSAGGGLLMTGGRRSFGPGGYFRSPLEPVLPVSMELRQEHRRLALALVVALDRSGSMAAEVAGGRTKMDLANLATAEVLGLLSPMDELGVVAVDSSAHEVYPLGPVEERFREVIRRRILSVESAGGGIFVEVALQAAAEALLDARAGTRHVLLFADAADAEEPGDYRRLLERAGEAGITVSVVGLGRETDVDAQLLREIAELGGGRVFFTEDPRELPRLFAQDTFVVSRSAFVEEPTPVRLTPGLVTVTGAPLPEPPAIGGFNLTYLRPEATLGAVTADDYEAPVVAAWQAGLGRAAVYTGEVDGEHTGAIAGWPRLGDLLTSLARWSAGEGGELGGGVVVTQELGPGTLGVRLHLDPERDGDPFLEPPSLTVLRDAPGRPPEPSRLELRWLDPDTLGAEVELAGDEVALPTLEVPGLGTTRLAPARLPYPPEWRPVEPGAGESLLEELARATGGRRRLAAGDVWSAFPRRPRVVELTPWLLLAAVLLFLAEVLERRTALLSLARFPRRRREKRPAPSPAAAESRRPPRRSEDRRPEEPPPASEPGPEPGGVVDALAEARRRASRRRASRRRG